MPREKTILVYQFEELSDRAKERARDWYRQSSAEAFSDYGDDAVLEDAATICGLLGISLKTERIPLHGGGVREQPVIRYSGFSSQGDGCSFEGTWAYQADAVAAIKAHAPVDEGLHAIAEALDAVQELCGHALSATIERRHSAGSYVHDRTVDIVIADERGDGTTNVAPGIRDTVDTSLRLLMRWIYKQLEQEYDYQQSAEYVDEQITANEYEFREDGRRVID